MLNIDVNGEQCAVLAFTTLAELIAGLGHEPERVATAVNGEALALGDGLGPFGSGFAVGHDAATELDHHTLAGHDGAADHNRSICQTLVYGSHANSSAPRSRRPETGRRGMC
jgi:hypothetical protein